MRTLVVLAVVGVCSATNYQAYNHGHNHGYNPGHNHGYNQGHNHGYNAGHNPSYSSGGSQPKWTGPVAATVPAGVGGKVIPVSETQEVSAARNAFFKVYQNQLAAVASGGQRYGDHGYQAPSVTHAAPAHHHGAGHHSYTSPVYNPTHSYGAPAHGAHAHHGVHAHGAPAHGPVGDTPEVAAAKNQFFQTFNKQAAAAAAAPDDYATYH